MPDDHPNINQAQATYQITPPDQFDFAKPNEWPQWIRRFERFRSATGLCDRDDVPAQHCNYGALHDELNRGRLVVGLLEDNLAEKLQLDSDLTLEKAIMKARQSESIKQQQSVIRGQGTSSESTDVDFVKKHQKYQARTLQVRLRQLQSSNKKLKGAGWHDLTVPGLFKATLKYGSRAAEQYVYVIKDLDFPLLGRPAIEQLKLVSMRALFPAFEKAAKYLSDACKEGDKVQIGERHKQLVQVISSTELVAKLKDFDVGADNALEHVNRSMKVSGGLIGKMLNPATRTKYSLIAPELARLAEQAKQMAGISQKTQNRHHNFTNAVWSLK
ncbi:predicted protein [Nematostella vectensis]|uniref:Uncharacterized protein n=1 Tax=Nematostella vectensis TaxID=45351 RepID=A7SXV7_NEMVE|nr:predicted protein [Nematostella vectensis]|eukprot:XP_001623565.1 predicted protein [Nematostella vectensis]